MKTESATGMGPTDEKNKEQDTLESAIELQALDYNKLNKYCLRHSG